jgi:Family of unknown function (DUF6529)
MTTPPGQRSRPAARRLVVAGLVAGTVTAVLFVAGRLHQPDYTSSMFGADPLRPKSLLASIALGLAGVQVLLALWLYRRLPLAPGRRRSCPPCTGRAEWCCSRSPCRSPCTAWWPTACSSPAPGWPSTPSPAASSTGRSPPSSPGPQQAAARMGAAHRRRHPCRHPRRAVVLLRTLVLQRPSAPPPLTNPPVLLATRARYRGGSAMRRRKPVTVQVAWSTVL